MISPTAKYINTVFESLPYLGNVLGVGEVVEIDGSKLPAYWHNGELQHINFDSHNSLVLLLKNGEVTRDTVEHPFLGNSEQITETYPYTALFYKKESENINCDSLFDGVINGAKKNLSGRKKDLATALNAENVTIGITKSNFDKFNIWDSIFTGEVKPKETDLLASFDLEVKITGNEQCFTGEPCIANDYNFELDSTSFCDAVKSCVGNVLSLEFSGANTTTYVKTELVDKEVLLVATDGRIRKSSDYTFDTLTGEVEFISVIQSAQKIYILYK